MKKIIITLLFLIMSNVNFAQDYKHDQIEISDLLSFEEFEEIKRFVLKEGHTMTYCSMYSNNPFYRFSKFELYLDPIVQFPDEKQKLDSNTYQELTLRIGFDDNTKKEIVSKKEYPFQYTKMRQDVETRKIYVKLYYESKEEWEPYKNTFGNYLKEILNEARLLNNETK